MGRKLDLPVPSFRKTNDYAYKRRTHTAKKACRGIRTDSYYHYEEPSAEELNNRVEYDMDLEDIVWLEKFNSDVARKKNLPLSENDFEKIMDRLEKESYFDNQRDGKYAVPTVDDDAVCAVCDDGDCSNANVILFCDMCDLAVHQDCYGVPYIPEGQWLCRRCLLSPLRNVNCQLCPNIDGAFKQTNDNKWAHVICAIWIPEVTFANTVFLEPIENVQRIEIARWKLVCYICKQKKNGACIQCSKKECLKSFHVTCAQQAKLYMKISNCNYNSPNGTPFIDVKKVAYCDHHTPKDGSSRSGMYSGDETDEDINTEYYKRKEDKRKKQLKQTRKLLAEKREDMKEKQVTSIKVDEKKLDRIAKCFGSRGKKNCLMQARVKDLRREYVDSIHHYWQLKRFSRNGVPLIRRLQVANYQNTNQPPDDDVDSDNFVRLRYDLEKCRLLIGEVKKREQLKKRLFVLNAEILSKVMDEIDANDPAE